jgi:glycosyltransferase involved in cell wall biosynthesis
VALDARETDAMRPTTIHVLHLASMSGAGRAHGERILHTCRGLENHDGAREFRGSVAMISGKGKCASILGTATEMGVDCYDVRRIGPCDPTLWFRLGRLIRRLSIDIVHTYDRESRAWALLLQPRFRFRMVANAFEPEVHTWGERLSREIDHKLLPGFDRVIAANAHLARQLCQLGCRMNQIDVIPEPEEEIAMPMDDADGTRLREQLVIPENASVVGIYLDGTDADGARRMADAVRYAQGRLGPMYTLGIGPDVQRAEVRTALLCSGLAPRLRMYDICDDLARVCRAADAMIFTGAKAGPATLEAQDAGTSVVATTSTGAMENEQDASPSVMVTADATSEVGAALVQALGRKRMHKREVAELMPDEHESEDFERTERLMGSYRRAMLV